MLCPKEILGKALDPSKILRRALRLSENRWKALHSSQSVEARMRIRCGPRTTSRTVGSRENLGMMASDPMKNWERH